MHCSRISFHWSALARRVRQPRCGPDWNPTSSNTRRVCPGPRSAKPMAGKWTLHAGRCSWGGNRTATSISGSKLIHALRLQPPPCCVYRGHRLEGDQWTFFSRNMKTCERSMAVTSRRCSDVGRPLIDHTPQEHLRARESSEPIARPSWLTDTAGNDIGSGHTKTTIVNERNRRCRGDCHIFHNAAIFLWTAGNHQAI